MRTLKSNQYGKYSILLNEDIDNENLFKKLSVSLCYGNNLTETIESFYYLNLGEAENFFDKMSALFEKLNAEVEFQEQFS
tara:strand:+ start:77 stop:316 length:240 start_codon:yes stop_codon:yes gene_type:complete